MNELIGDDGSDVDISIDEFLNDDNDGDFRNIKNTQLKVVNVSSSSYFDEKSFFVVDDSASDISFPTKRRGKKRRIAFASQRMFPYHTPSTVADDNVGKVFVVSEKNFEFNKELLCVGCARELQPDALQGFIHLNIH